MIERPLAIAIILSLISEGCAVTTRVPEQRMTSTYERRGQPPAPMLEVSGTAAETDCEMKRARELMDRLQKAEGARVKQLTLTAIILGAAAIVTGGFGLAAGRAVAL